MRRVLVIAAAATMALALAGPLEAQEQPPTKLWSEYPLVQPVERSSAPEAPDVPSIGPLLPPTDTESVSSASDSVNWSLWLLVAALGVVGFFVLARVARMSSAASVAEPVPRSAPRVYAPGPLAQYAPTRPRDQADGLVEEPPRSIVLRTGLLRARYVVVSDEWAGGLETVGGSRSFWRFGPAALRTRVSDQAWDDLVNDLRVQGWEPNFLRRSEYYVLLQRVEDEPIPLREPTPL